MKKQLFQAATLLVATMVLFHGCDKAEKVIEEPTNGLVQVVAKAMAGDPETRIGYSESGNRMNYTWGEVNTEKFSVFVPSSNAKHDFLLTNGARTKNGTFSGSLPVGATTTNAIYPALNADPADATAIEHNLSNQGLYTTTEALFGNTKHLMWATADATGGELNYQFTHKVSMLKLELTFTGVTSKIKSVSIYGAHKEANLNVTNGVLSYETADKGVITASDATGFDLVGNVLTAYVYLFPENLSGVRLSITATDASGKEYTSGAFDGRILNAGTVYRLSKNMLESDYIVAGNLKWSKGNLIADGPNGAKIGAPGDGGLYFQYGSLVAWSGNGNMDGTSRGAGNPLSLQVKPVTCSISTWNSTWTSDPTFDDPVNGIGDPCRYYLGDPWRLPTKRELNALFGQPPTSEDLLYWGSATSAVGWSKEGQFVSGSTNSYASHSSGLKFSNSGLRHSSDGHLGSLGSGGYYWLRDRDPDSDIAYPFFFTDFLIVSGPSEGYSFDMPRGFPVRCVRN